MKGIPSSTNKSSPPTHTKLTVPVVEQFLGYNIEKKSGGS